MTNTDLAAYALRIHVTDDVGYDALYKPGLLEEYGSLCRGLLPRADAGLVVLTDDRVERIYGDRLRESLRAADLDPPFLKVSDGESSKSLPTFEHILDELARLGMDRRGLVVNFGGGVISDLGGFVASAYMRGIAYANFSTSLIGQLDAAVGGKVAVNSRHAKNMIGAFHHPIHVAGDPTMIETLSKRDFRSGIAEAIKIGVIASPELFSILESQVEALRSCDPSVLTDVIGRTAEIKMELVARDPYEEDLRRPLNFGHTLGHPIETDFAYEKVRHGEAVAVGMAVATFIARAKRAISAADANRILELLSAYELIGCAPPIRAEAVIKHLRYVKMIRGNRLHFVLPTAVGDVVVTEKVGRGELLHGFAEYEELCVSSGRREAS